MKSLVLALILSAHIVLAADSTQLRPALIGSSADAIINRIDTKGLIAKGQGDAIMQFCAAVNHEGAVVWSTVFGASENAKLFENEVRRVVATGRMIPAMREGKPVSVLFYGTVTFRVVDGKSRLRIFANQEAPEIEKESDFISPQPCLAGDVFVGFRYPNAATEIPLDAVVRISLKVDEKGVVHEAAVVEERPPLLGFGDAAMLQFGKATFIPAYRGGKPTACEFTISALYQPD